MKYCMCNKCVCTNVLINGYNYNYNYNNYNYNYNNIKAVGLDNLTRSFNVAANILLHICGRYVTKSSIQEVCS